MRLLSRRPSGDLPSLAVVTMLRDEGVMLPRWIDYYAGQVGADALLVVDDNSTDGGTADLPCPVVRIPPLGEREFEPARMAILSGLAEGLLGAYDAVLFADVDEFVVPDPERHAGLREFLAARSKEPILGALGLNVVHDLAREGDLDPARPVLEQRHVAKFLPLMCKPCLKRVPAKWGHASHGIFAPYSIDPDLYMFHLKFADREHLRRIAQHRNEMVAFDGRAATTSWKFSGDEMVSLLERINVELAAGVPEPFKVPTKRLDKIVQLQPNGLYKASGLGQVDAMEKLAFVGIPERFVGTF